MKYNQVKIMFIAVLVCLGLIALSVVDFFRNPFISHWRLVMTIERQSSVELQLTADESTLTLRLVNNTDYLYYYGPGQHSWIRDWMWRWRGVPPYRLNSFGFQDIAIPLPPYSYDVIAAIPLELLDDFPNGEYIIIMYAMRGLGSPSFRVAVRFSLPLNLN